MSATETIVKKSPVGSAFVSAFTFVSLFYLGTFSLGIDLLAALAVGLVSYYAQKYSPLLLVAFLLIPLYEILRPFSSSVNSTNVGAFFTLTVFLVIVALSVTAGDWLGALVGLWLGLFLLNGYTLLIVIPAVVALAFFRSVRSAAIAAAELSLFGVFYQVAAYIGYHPFPLTSGAGTLFSTAPTNAYGLLMGIISIASGGSASSFYSYVSLSFVPIFFVIAMIITLVAAYIGVRYGYRMRIGPSSGIVSAAIVSLIGSALIFNEYSYVAGSIVVVIIIGLLYLVLKPTLGPRPMLSISAVKAVFSPPAFIQAGEYGEGDYIRINEKPGKSAVMKESWSRLTGMDAVKEELLKSIVLPMKNRDEAKRFGVKPAKGILLYGPPGTGKTTTLRGLAAYLGMRYIEVNPGSVLSKWYGESEQKVKGIFDNALGNPPSIIAIDEIDGIGKTRTEESGDSGTSQRLLNVILMGMDSVFKSDADVVLVATTNKPDLLDKALLRAGRFDKIIYVGPPDEKARRDIFELYLKGKAAVDQGIDYDKLAKMSERFTGADIEGLVNKVLSSTFYDSVKGRQKKDRNREGKDSSPAVVTQQMLEDAIKSTRPSIGFAMLEEYERFRVEYQRERQIQKGWESGIQNVMFQDIGDLEYAKEQLREAFELPLKEPELMEKLKVRPVKGVLLYGPPGNGKTLLAKAAATEFSANFFVISGADLSRGNPAHAAARIKELFNIARDNVPSIIFIDELDQIAPNRSSIASEIFVPVTNQLLDELDGIRELKGVMVLASTNRPDSVDPALLRANRLEKHIEIPFPDEAARLKIMEVCLKGVAVSDGVSLDKYAKATDGFSGADIQEFVNEAKKSVLRRKIKGDQAAEAIKGSDFEEGLKAKKGKGSQINQNS